MDSFEWNKIFGGILGSLLAIAAIREVAAVAYHHEAQKELAYSVELPEKPSAGSTEVVEVVVDYGTLLGATDPAAGQRVASRCVSCHNFDKGEPNKIGPNLYGVIGRDIASVEGFQYSKTLQGLEGVWTFEKMDKFLENPRSWAPGTSMSYGGLKRQNDRMRIIAYLRSQADEMYPLPAPLAATETPDENGDGGDEASGDDGAPATDEAAAVPTQDGGAN